MKIIKNIIRIIIAFFRTLYKLLDKFIIIPITKFIVMIMDKMGNKTDRFEKFITRRDTLIFISLILDVLLFFYVDSESTAIITDSAEVLYGQKVEVTYNNKSYVIEGLPETVDVTLIGRKVDLYLAKQLASGVVTADLSNLNEGMHTISLDYDCAINSVDYKLDPSVVNVTVYPKVSQNRTATIDVINKNKLDKKLSIDSVELDNYDIVIKGAEHTLKKVATVKALIDIEKIVEPAIGVREFDGVKLVAYDANGKVVENVEMEPNKIVAKINIISPSKKVPIKVIPTNIEDIEFGKAIESITTDITELTVYGDKDVLDEMEYLPVEVDVSKLNQNKEYDVIISKPSGIRDLSKTNVKVNIKIGDEITKEISDVSIETINLSNEYKAVAVGANSSKTSVILKGAKSVIDTIDESIIKAIVDLDGYTEGEYEVDVKVNGDENKVTYTPKTTKIKIKISKK